MRYVEITVETLTAERFAPFGTIFGGTAEPEAAAEAVRFARAYPLALPSPGLLKSLRMVRKPLRFYMAECHEGLAQTFIPLERDPAIMVVAPPASTPPPPEAYRAFSMDGTVSVMLAPGVWHAMASPMPVLERGARYLMITDEATDAELRAFDEGRLDTAGMSLSRIADYIALADVELVLLAPAEEGWLAAGEQRG